MINITQDIDLYKESSESEITKFSRKIKITQKVLEDSGEIAYIGKSQ